MITLYGSGQSRSFRAVWALEEAGLDYKYIKLQFGSDQNNGSLNKNYRAKNSQGKVPTLVHNDFVLTESGAILNYIARLKPETSLLITAEDGIEQMARFEEMRDYILTELEQPLWSNGKHRFALPPDYRIDAMLKTANYEFRKAINSLPQFFEGGSFALAKAGIERFTLNDILLAQTLHWAERFKFSLPQELIDYRDAQYRREACQRALQRIQQEEEKQQA